MSEGRKDPVLQGVLEARVVPGISGAQVFILTRDRRHWFVRKAARDPAGSARLRAQARKQAAFSDSIAGVLQTPRILDEGEEAGRFYFDMELVRGPDGASYLRSAPLAEVTRFADRLCQYMALAATRPAIGPARTQSSFEALYVRVCEAQRKTAALEPAVLARLLMALDGLRTQGPASASLCHGDLTLENLVVGEDGMIWVIDLLDPPFEHWWNDVAKLHQDLAGGWFLRHQRPVASSVTQYVSGRLLDQAAALTPAYTNLHATLVACNFVRILPYVSSDEQRRFLIDRIQHFVAQT